MRRSILRDCRHNWNIFLLLFIYRSDVQLISLYRMPYVAVNSCRIHLLKVLATRVHFHGGDPTTVWLEHVDVEAFVAASTGAVLILTAVSTLALQLLQRLVIASGYHLFIIEVFILLMILKSIISSDSILYYIIFC